MFVPTRRQCYHGKGDHEKRSETMPRNYPAIRRVLIITMLLNWLAALAKLAVGLLTGALSLVADGLDSLFDGLANIIGLIGIAVGSRPPDDDHPYGHRKFETLAALIIASLLFFTAWELAQSAIQRLRTPQPVTVNLWSLAALVFSMVVQGATSVYELRAGRRLNSEVLVADAFHARASILASLAVMGGLIAVYLGYPIADPLITLGLAVFIAKIGVDIVRENTPALVDQAAVDRELVANVVGAVPGVESFHQIRSRGPADAGQLDLHVRVAPDLSMQQGNAIADEVRRRLLALDSVADVTVHVEAQRQPGREAEEVDAIVHHAAQEFGLQVHETWTHQLQGRMILEVHIGVDPALSVGKAHELVDQFERAVLTRLPQLAACETHIELHSPEVLPGAEVSRALHNQVAAAVQKATAQTNGLRHAHNIAVRQSEGRLTASFEVVADQDLPIADAHELTEQVETRLRSQIPHLTDVLIHVEPQEQDNDKDPGPPSGGQDGRPPR